MTYIIIGGNGFIGSSLCRYLYHEQVIALGRTSGHSIAGRETYFSVREYSLDEIAGFLPEGERMIIDLSYTSVSNTNLLDPGQEFSDNLNLVVDNLRFAKKANAIKYVYISSGGTVYGRSGEEQIDESHATDPISNYGVTKLASEKYVSMFCSLNGIGYNILRPSNVYGPGQIPFRGQGIIATALGSAHQHLPISIFGKGDNIRDYIYIDDFLKWLMAICSLAPGGQLYNAGSGRGYSILDIIHVIRSILPMDRYPLPLQYLPERAFDVKRNVLNNNKIIAATGMDVATGLREGIASTWEWIHEYLASRKVEPELR